MRYTYNINTGGRGCFFLFKECTTSRKVLYWSRSKSYDPKKKIILPLTNHFSKEINMELVSHP